jgi:hypothetical protein
MGLTGLPALSIRTIASTPVSADSERWPMIKIDARPEAIIFDPSKLLSSLSICKTTSVRRAACSIVLASTSAAFVPLFRR